MEGAADLEGPLGRGGGGSPCLLHRNPSCLSCPGHGPPLHTLTVRSPLCLDAAHRPASNADRPRVTVTRSFLRHPEPSGWSSPRFPPPPPRTPETETSDSAPVLTPTLQTPCRPPVARSTALCVLSPTAVSHGTGRHGLAQAWLPGQHMAGHSPGHYLLVSWKGLGGQSVTRSRTEGPQGPGT